MVQNLAPKLTTNYCEWLHQCDIVYTAFISLLWTTVTECFTY